MSRLFVDSFRGAHQGLLRFILIHLLLYLDVSGHPFVVLEQDHDFILCTVAAGILDSLDTNRVPVSFFEQLVQNSGNRIDLAIGVQETPVSIKLVIRFGSVNIIEIIRIFGGIALVHLLHRISLDFGQN